MTNRAEIAIKLDIHKNGQNLKVLMNPKLQERDIRSYADFLNVTFEQNALTPMFQSLRLIK